MQSRFRPPEHRTCPILAVLLLAAGCGDAPGSRAIAWSQEDDASIVFENEDTAVFQHDGETNQARVDWTGDLNEDGVTDHIVHLPEYTGSHGHQFIAVCAGTSSGGFDVVWGPDYAQRISVDETNRGRSGWLRLVWHDEDPLEGVAPVQRMLTFNGREYVFRDP